LIGLLSAKLLARGEPGEIAKNICSIFSALPVYRVWYFHLLAYQELEAPASLFLRAFNQ
jgi:hypothetical protein